VRTRQLSDGRVSLEVSQLCLGTMYFGYRTDEPTSLAILDRFTEAGGNFLDTANNYGQWHGDAGESERVLGRWRRSRGVGSEVVIATKVGARTLLPGDPSPEHWQGLGAKSIREDAETSRRQLGVERLDLYYAHIDDRDTPQEETVDALAELAEEGVVGLLGASNHATWRIDRGRAIARADGRPAYQCVQQEYSYLLAMPDRGQVNLITEELVDYATAEGLDLLAYSPLLKGPTPAPSSRCRPATTTPATGPGWPPSARSRPSWAPPPTRSCWPGSWVATRRSSRWSGPAAWPSWTRSSAPSTCAWTTTPASA
jgi:aryl-alcohol dehydrogenase-like predicted oxidoreductase